MSIFCLKFFALLLNFLSQISALNFNYYIFYLPVCFPLYLISKMLNSSASSVENLKIIFGEDDDPLKEIMPRPDPC